MEIRLKTGLVQKRECSSQSLRS